MNTMLRWSPSRQFHFHHDVEDHQGSMADESGEDAVFDNHLADTATETYDRELDYTLEENSEHVLADIDAALNRIENGTYVIQLALPGVDPKDVAVSLMDNVLTVKGERKADPDTTDKDYFVREVAYGGFQRSFALPEGVDATQVEAKYANGMLEVRIPAPRAAMPRTIEVKAA